MCLRVNLNTVFFLRFIETFQNLRKWCFLPNLAVLFFFFFFFYCFFFFFCWVLPPLAGLMAQFLQLIEPPLTSFTCSSLLLLPHHCQRAVFKSFGASQQSVENSPNWGTCELITVIRYLSADNKNDTKLEHSAFNSVLMVSFSFINET